MATLQANNAKADSTPAKADEGVTSSSYSKNLQQDFTRPDPKQILLDKSLGAKNQPDLKGATFSPNTQSAGSARDFIKEMQQELGQGSIRPEARNQQPFTNTPLKNPEKVDSNKDKGVTPKLEAVNEMWSPLSRTVAPQKEGKVISPSTNDRHLDNSKNFDSPLASHLSRSGGSSGSAMEQEFLARSGIVQRTSPGSGHLLDSIEGLGKSTERFDKSNTKPLGKEILPKADKLKGIELDQYGLEVITYKDFRLHVDPNLSQEQKTQLRMNCIHGRDKSAEKCFPDRVGKTFPNPVDVYVWPDNKSFAIATDSKDVTKLPLGLSNHAIDKDGKSIHEIHVNPGAAFNNLNVWVHEFGHAHVFNKFHQELNLKGAHHRWCDEGMAVATESKQEIGELVSLAKTLLGKGQLFEMEQFLKIQKYPVDNERMSAFYAQSTALVQFLLDRGSHEQYWNFVKLGHTEGYDNAVKAIGFKSVSELEGAFQKWLSVSGNKDAFKKAGFGL